MERARYPRGEPVLLFCPLSRRRQRMYRRQKLRRMDRLGSIGVHSGLQTPFRVTLDGVRCGRNDDLVAASGFFSHANSTCSLQAVHLGICMSVSTISKCRLSSRSRTSRPLVASATKMSPPFEQGHDYALVDGIVFGYPDSRSFRLFLFARRGAREWARYRGSHKYRDGAGVSGDRPVWCDVR